MKILLVTDAYSHLMNGVAMVVSTLAESYRNMGHDVRVLTISGDCESHSENGVYYLPSYNVPIYPDFRVSIAHGHPYLKMLKKWKPDIVHIHSEASASILAKSVAKATNSPIIMTWHTDYAKFAFHKYHSLKAVEFVAKNLMKLAYRGACIITVPSYKAKTLLDGYKVKFPSTIIPNGISLDRFYRDVTDDEKKARRIKHNIPENRKILVVLSRLSSEKNISEILEYFPELLKHEPELHLVIAGTGPDSEHLEHLSSKLGINDHVTFTGFVQPESTYLYYKLGTAFLSASTFEMHSLTYLEAMACGLPLICREDLCLKGVLDDGFNGYIYKTKDEFISKTLSILQNDERQREMSENALERSERFGNEAFAKNMINLYHNVLYVKGKKRKKKLLRFVMKNT